MIKIMDKSKCCGCEACVQRCPKHCIHLVEDKEGYRYPIVDKAICVSCGLCEKVCPIINENEQQKPIEVLAAKNPDEQQRLAGSSGGVFFEVGRNIINNGGVVFGARFDENWNVIHSYAEDVDGLNAFRGSKYVQSYVGDSYKEAENFLKGGRQVLFSGTPCQIAGLQRFLRKKYDNLLLVDVVCHGVPSSMPWQKFLDEAIRPQNMSSETLRKQITSVLFRCKENGWLKYHLKVILNPLNGISTNSRNSIFSKYHRDTDFFYGFLRQYFLRPSCYDCKFRCGKSHSDITLADFWGIWDHTDRWNDDRGISLVMLNTEKGKAIFDTLNVNAFLSDYQTAISGNKSIIESPRKPVERCFVFRHLNRGKKLHDAFSFNFIEKLLIKLGYKLNRFV